MRSSIFILVGILANVGHLQDRQLITEPRGLLGHYQFTWEPHDAWERTSARFPNFIQFDMVDPDSTNRLQSFKIEAIFFGDTQEDCDTLCRCLCPDSRVTQDSVCFSTSDCSPSRYEFRGRWRTQGSTSPEQRFQIDGVLKHFLGKKMMTKASVQFSWIEGC